MNKIHVYKIILLLLLAALLFVFNNCMPTVPGQKSSYSGSRSPSSTPLPKPVPKTQEEVLNAIQVEVGVKNFEQILHTMSELTGVSAMDNDIRSVYNEVSPSLPTGNDIKVFMASHQVAITKLAAEFCNELVNSTTLRTALLPGFTCRNATDSCFGRNPNEAFTPANKTYLVDTFIDSFWMIASDQEKSMAQQELLPLFDELLLNETNNTTTTRNTVKGLCTSVLSSVQVILL